MLLGLVAVSALTPAADAALPATAWRLGLAGAGVLAHRYLLGVLIQRHIRIYIYIYIYIHTSLSIYTHIYKYIYIYMYIYIYIYVYRSRQSKPGELAALASPHRSPME